MFYVTQLKTLLHGCFAQVTLATLSWIIRFRPGLLAKISIRDLSNREVLRAQTPSAPFPMSSLTKFCSSDAGAVDSSAVIRLSATPGLVRLHAVFRCKFLLFVAAPL